MAGRPRTMARKVAELEGLASELADRLDSVAPQQYRGKVNPQDALAVAWSDALNAVWMAVYELESLTDLLCAKAGITEPGPFAQLSADDPDAGGAEHVAASLPGVAP